LVIGVFGYLFGVAGAAVGFGLMLWALSAKCLADILIVNAWFMPKCNMHWSGCWGS
jgi:hypothetical protein